jgi:hypothetical protein
VYTETGTHGSVGEGRRIIPSLDSNQFATTILPGISSKEHFPSNKKKLAYLIAIYQKEVATTIAWLYQYLFSSKTENRDKLLPLQISFYAFVSNT